MKKLGYVLALAALVAFFAAPAPASAQHEDFFWVELDAAGEVVWANSGGTGFPYGDPLNPGEDGLGEWFYYPFTDWWNQWFYDDPYDPERMKKVVIEVWVEPTDTPSFLTVALNYSTGLWSEVGNPELPRVPPIGPFADLAEEESFIVREELFSGEILGPTPRTFKWVIEDFNPEWVSIDVRGINVRIAQVPEPGYIWHLCMPPIPAVSEWGLVVMALLGLTVGTIMYRKFRAVPA